MKNKNKSKKFTNVIRSLEDALEFDTEDTIEKYEKFNGSKQPARSEFGEFESPKKPVKHREQRNTDFEEEELF
jgi:hypothetical protein